MAHTADQSVCHENRYFALRKPRPEDMMKPRSGAFGGSPGSAAINA